MAKQFLVMLQEESFFATKKQQKCKKNTHNKNTEKCNKYSGTISETCKRAFKILL